MLVFRILPHKNKKKKPIGFFFFFEGPKGRIPEVRLRDSVHSPFSPLTVVKPSGVHLKLVLRFSDFGKAMFKPMR